MAPTGEQQRSIWMSDEWGPLGKLVGEWEGEGGLDSAYSHAKHEVLATPYLEKLTFKPFGPVQNGRQFLYGLDYKSAMWRDSEENPFHTEVGYWLWDGATGEVMRGFVVPRGIVVLAGGTATADAKSFTLTATPGDPQYAIGENKYLAAERVDVELQRHHHTQRRWHVDVRRDHDAQDEGVRRTLLALGSQHLAQGRLTGRIVTSRREPDHGAADGLTLLPSRRSAAGRSDERNLLADDGADLARREQLRAARRAASRRRGARGS